MFWSVYKLLNEIWPISSAILNHFYDFTPFWPGVFHIPIFATGFSVPKNSRPKFLEFRSYIGPIGVEKKIRGKNSFIFLKRNLPECRFRHKKSRGLKKKNYKGKSTDLRTRCFVLLWFEEFSLIQRKEFFWHSVKSNVLTRKDIVREGSGLDPGQLWKTRCVTWTRVADDPKLLYQFMCLEFSE